MDQLLFEQNPNPMLIYDLETLRILKVNAVFSRKYKYSSEEIEERGLTIIRIRPEEDIPKFKESLYHLERTGIKEVGVFRHQSKTGNIFYVSLTSQDITFEGRKARLVVCHDITRQVEAEKKSTSALEELQHHIENSPLASVKWDHEFQIMEWSGTAEKISGYSAAEVIGKDLFSIDFFNSAESGQIKKNIESLVSGKADNNQFETRVKHKNGDQIYIKVHSSALSDEDGDLHSVLTLIEDITEQKKSEIKYQRLFENANDGILILKDGLFVDCNKQAEKLFRASKPEILGKSPDYFSPGKQPDGSCSATEVSKRIDRALKTGSHLFEWQHQNTRDDLIDVEVSLNKIAFPDGEYLQAIIRDVTNKKRTQAELKKNEELFRNLFLKSPAALVMVDADDRIQLINESFENMFGYSLGEVKGKNIDKLVVPEGEAAHFPKIKTRSYVDQDFQIEGKRVTKCGTTKHVLIAGMPVYIDGKPVAGLGMYLDITAHKESERELKKSLEEKQVLLEEVHHRVKNNLAVVSGLLEMQTMHVGDERLTRYIQNSQLRIQSMALVHEMLYKSSTLSEIKFQNYVGKLVSVISNVLEPGVKNIAIEIDVDNFVLNVNQAIPCALVISELLTNAYEYAFEGREGGKVVIDIVENGDMIDVSVKDNGVGLPNDFKQKKEKSLGINLMENLCLQLETNIGVESGEWGTRFFFTFKRTNKPGSSSLNRI